MSLGKALDAFFTSLTEEQKQAIRYVGIDSSNAYNAAALTHLTHIEICYDAYHLVSNMNEVVDKIRRKEMAQPPEALRRRLVGMRCNLLRANEKLVKSVSIRFSYSTAHLIRLIYLSNNSVASFDATTNIMLYYHLLHGLR